MAPRRGRVAGMRPGQGRRAGAGELVVVISRRTSAARSCRSAALSDVERAALGTGGRKVGLAIGSKMRAEHRGGHRAAEARLLDSTVDRRTAGRRPAMNAGEQ